MGKTSCDAILKKIEKIEEYLEKIEKNGRVNEEEVWHKRRSEIDGKTVKTNIYSTQDKILMITYRLTTSSCTDNRRLEQESLGCSGI